MNPDDFIGIKLTAAIAGLYQYKVEDIAFDEEELLGKRDEETDEAAIEAAFRNPW